MKVQLRICTASDISKILTNFYEHLGQFNLKEFSNITNGINPKKCLSFHAITYLRHDREARQFALRRTVKINDKLACSRPITVKYYAKLQVMCFSLLSTTFYFTFITIKTIPINKYQLCSHKIFSTINRIVLLRYKLQKQFHLECKNFQTALDFDIILFNISQKVNTAFLFSKSVTYDAAGFP